MCWRLDCSTQQVLGQPKLKKGGHEFEREGIKAWGWEDMEGLKGEKRRGNDAIYILSIKTFKP